MLYIRELRILLAAVEEVKAIVLAVASSKPDSICKTDSWIILGLLRISQIIGGK